MQEVSVHFAIKFLSTNGIHELKQGTKPKEEASKREVLHGASSVDSMPLIGLGHRLGWRTYLDTSLGARE